MHRVMVLLNQAPFALKDNIILLIPILYEDAHY